MSGHSKWSHIKRKKELKDKAKGSLFSKLSRAIILSVIEGGGVTDPGNNLRLRLAIDKAKELNMPKGNIDRAIAKGTGPNREMIREVIFEAFAPFGVTIIILAATDNVNRTLGLVKHTLDQHHAKLGTPGSVSYLFTKCGLMTFAKSKVPEEQIFLLAEKFGAFDIDTDKFFYYAYIPFDHLGKIKHQEEKIPYENFDIDYKPHSLITIPKQEDAHKLLDLIEALEELDDVQKVFANFDISYEV